MSYTNLNQLRNHIEFVQPVSNIIYDQLVLCDTDSYIKIYNGSIAENCLVLKTLSDNVPTNFTTTITESTFLINSNPIVRGSLICTSDSSLGTLFSENIDYIIDYAKATCTIKENGSLQIGMTITCFFIPYSLYTENNDYRVDYNSGEIQRIPSGNIQLGETFFVDYEPIHNNYTDEILNNAVIEANAIIEKQVDPNKQYGANLVLQTAATYRALEILCRSSAMRELINQTKNNNTSEWIKLADIYLKRSENLILSFKPPMNQIQNPTHS